MIRVATHADLPRILELGEALHALSSYAPISFDREKVATTMGSLIDGAGVVFLAERDGIVVGGFAGAVSEFWFSTERLAYDYSFFIELSARNGITAMKLLTAFREWARIKGAKHLRLGITTGLHVESTARLYRAFGLVECGPLFQMEV